MQTNRKAKQRNDELEFSRVPYSDPKHLLVTVIEAGGGGGGGGGGALASLNNR